MICFPYQQQQFDDLNEMMEVIDLSLLEKDCTPEKFTDLRQKKLELENMHEELMQELYEMNYEDDDDTI